MAVPSRVNAACTHARPRPALPGLHHDASRQCGVAVKHGFVRACLQHPYLQVLPHLKRIRTVTGGPGSQCSSPGSAAAAAAAARQSEAFGPGGFQAQAAADLAVASAGDAAAAAALCGMDWQQPQQEQQQRRQAAEDEDPWVSFCPVQADHCCVSACSHTSATCLWSSSFCSMHTRTSNTTALAIRSSRVGL